MHARTLFALTLAAALFGALVTHPASAQPKPAQLQTAGSEIAFTTKQMGVPVEGKFGKFSAQITLDPKKPETGNVTFTIDTGSARFGSAELDAEVPKATWLNVPKFPQATFQSSAIKAAGPGKFEVTGKLAIKGVLRDVVVPVQVAQAGATSTASGSFTIKRLAFKVGENEWADTSMLADDIQIRFKLMLTGLPAL
jgi:polyisoprenoid-binding protein YceI